MKKRKRQLPQGIRSARDAPPNQGPVLPGWMVSANIRWVFVVAAAFLAIVPRLFFLNVPFERDEGCYAYISDTIDRGGLPYRDGFDHKPPGIYYLYNLSFKLFGHSVAAPRVTALLFTVAACLLTFLLVKKMGGSLWGGIISMAFLGLASASPAYLGFNANTEIFTLPFLVGGCLLLFGANGLGCRFFAAGLLLGIAFVIKQVALAVAAPVFLCAAFPLRKRPRTLISEFLLFTTGAAAPFTLFALFFAAKGAFHDFWAGFFIYNRSYVGEVSWSAALHMFQSAVIRVAEREPVLWLAAASGIVIYLASERQLFGRWFLTSMVAGSFAATVMGKYFYSHYFVVMLPFLAASVGLGTSVPRQKAGRSWALSLGGVLFMTALAFQIRFFTLRSNLLLHELYGDNPFYQSVGVGSFLRARAKPEARVFIIGSEGQILFYSGLQASSRIFYFYPLVLGTPLQEAFRREVISTLRARPPDYLVMVNSASSHFIPWHSADPYLRMLFSSLPKCSLIGFSAFGSDEVSSDPATVMGGLQAKPPGSILIFERISGPGADSRVPLSPESTSR